MKKWLWFIQSFIVTHSCGVKYEPRFDDALSLSESVDRFIFRSKCQMNSTRCFTFLDKFIYEAEQIEFRLVNKSLMVATLLSITNNCFGARNFDVLPIIKYTHTQTPENTSYAYRHTTSGRHHRSNMATMEYRIVVTSVYW